MQLGLSAFDPIKWPHLDQIAVVHAGHGRNLDDPAEGFRLRLGTDAVAAVGITEALVTVLYGTAIGLGVGLTAMVSRRIGANDAAGAAAVTVTSLGTYTISDSTITVTTTSSTIPEIELGADTFTISLNGNRLTFEDDETRFVFDKQ